VCGPLHAVRVRQRSGFQRQVISHDQRPAVGVQAGLHAVRRLAAGARERRGAGRISLRPRRPRYFRGAAEERLPRQARVLAELLRAFPFSARDIIVSMSRVVRRVVSASLLLFAYVAAACTTAPASPTTTAPFSQSDLKIGTGDAAVVIGNLLSVNYTGWLYDATKTDLKGGVFDSSIGRQAFTFTIGSGQVIKGWDRGIIGMKVGG